ncbi:response regulator [Methylobacterium haplocladii]|uniref:Response regulator n=1 Tax=Methylobacterium haplocladii TaxID=1176176 RepID=A0A512IU06_9HYPH|nr:response regulator [Methylobacterium haplocladii]GEP01171.1 response regulator [Methylobacterium haplocladii]GJD82869.1 Protein-glutamate methylesterase/protein-glutamine glutaminase [Methylobacterium haplocladii]GLS59004.1 response regulator [Methylobacterium haplocladii]
MSEPLRVLLVEDEALILMQLEMLLEDAGHVIVGTAMTAEDGVTLVHETRPELVFVDLRLGDGSSGLDVARAVREIGGVTAVFITANSRQLSEDLEGAAAVISKPFSASVMEDTLAFLEEGLRRPPPVLAVPHGMILAPAYRASWAPAAP